MRDHTDPVKLSADLHESQKNEATPEGVASAHTQICGASG